MTDVTYYVALPFTEDDTGSAVPGAAEEFQSPSTALRRAETLSHMPGVVGAVAFSRSGDPMVSTSMSPSPRSGSSSTLTRGWAGSPPSART